MEPLSEPMSTWDPMDAPKDPALSCSSPPMTRVLPSRSSITSTGRAETLKSGKTAMPVVLSAWAAVLVAVVVDLVVVALVAVMAAVAASVVEAASAGDTVGEEGTAEVDPQVEPASTQAVLHLLLPHLTRSPITLSPAQRRASSSMSET